MEVIYPDGTHTQTHTHTRERVHTGMALFAVVWLNLILTFVEAAR